MSGYRDPNELLPVIAPPGPDHGQLMSVDVCERCGGLVADYGKHDRFHAELEDLQEEAWGTGR